jgi:alpha-L-fucosidase
MKRRPTRHVLLAFLVLLPSCANGGDLASETPASDGGLDAPDGSPSPGHDAGSTGADASHAVDSSLPSNDSSAPPSDSSLPPSDSSLPSSDSGAPSVAPPTPFLPVPDADQLAWQELELTMFNHFGMDTFGTSTIGTGMESPNLFQPTALDPSQWVMAAQSAGFKGMILTAKHHDGFCLWPTKTTTHSVQYSSWMNGQGDVVRMFADACHAAGMKMGIYCSPYDLNAPTFTADPASYSMLYEQQLTELMSNYGDVFEMWFDGNHAASIPNWDQIIQVPRTLQPHAILKQGPVHTPVLEDIRWVGNMAAHAPLTNWSAYPGPNQPGAIWFPVESDISMIGDWFWNPNNTVPMTLEQILDIYYFSVGRNSLFLLNVAPDRTGQLSASSVQRLSDFHAALTSIFGTDFAAGRPVTASNVRGGDPAYGGDKAVDGDPATYWATDDGVTSASLEVDLGAAQTFNVVRIEEEIALGQRVEAYQLDALTPAGTWQPMFPAGSLTTIGHKKLDRFPAISASKVRLTIVSAYAPPTIRALGVHMDGVSQAADFQPAHALGL